MPATIAKPFRGMRLHIFLGAYIVGNTRLFPRDLAIDPSIGIRIADNVFAIPVGTRYPFLAEAL